MKSYIVDRSSSTPQLTEMPTNVEKIYQTKEAAETALANGDIADGEFVSTVDTVTDEGDKFDKSYLSYSTEETLTGGTWIDGKPIYRRTFNWTSTVSNSTHFEIPYLSTMVDCGYIVRDDNSANAAVPTVGFYNRGLSTCYLMLAWLGGNSSWTSTNGHWWVEYTKQ